MKTYFFIFALFFPFVTQAQGPSCSLSESGLPKCAAALESHMRAVGGQVTAPISCFNDRYVVFVHFEDGGYSVDNAETFNVDESTCQFTHVLY